jgi:hypothetical protein
MPCRSRTGIVDEPLIALVKLSFCAGVHGRRVALGRPAQRLRGTGGSHASTAASSTIVAARHRSSPDLFGGCLTALREVSRVSSRARASAKGIPMTQPHAQRQGRTKVDAAPNTPLAVGPSRPPRALTGTKIRLRRVAVRRVHGARGRQCRRALCVTPMSAVEGEERDDRSRDWTGAWPKPCRRVVDRSPGAAVRLLPVGPGDGGDARSRTTTPNPTTRRSTPRCRATICRCGTYGAVRTRSRTRAKKLEVRA